MEPQRNTGNALIADWRGLRAALQLSQAQMATFCGCHESTILRLEQGKHARASRVMQLYVRAKLDNPVWRQRIEAAGYRFPTI